MKKLILFVAVAFAAFTIQAQDVLQGKLFDNTYVSVGVGGVVSNMGDFENTRPAFGVEVGKNVTTLYDMSVEFKSTVNNKDIKTAFDDFSLIWNHKLNVGNLVYGYSPERKTELKTVCGIGWGHTNGSITDKHVVFEAGIEGIYNISKAWSVFINPTYIWNEASKGLNYNNSELEVTVGLTYKFRNRNGGRGFMICDRNNLLADCERLNAEVNELREKYNSQLVSLNEVKAASQHKDIQIAEFGSKANNSVNSIVVPSVIGFEIGKTNVNSTSKGSLIKLAQFLNENKDLKVTIEGYADSKTGTTERNQTLSELRADSVKKILVDNGVSSDRITVIGKGSSIQPFTENDINRAVITIVQ